MVGAAFTETIANLVDEGFDFGLKDYPIFNEEYRAHLNKKIIEHYMFYEIGYETETMFRFALNRKMREIMPLYNQRYKSCFIAFDALSTQDSTENVTSSNRGTSRETSKDDETSKRNAQEHADDTTQTATHETGDETGTRSTDGTSHNATRETGTTDSTGTENTTSKSDSTNTSRSAARNVASEFPQTMLSENGDYATNAADAVNESHGTSNANASGTKETTDHGSSSTQGTADGTTHEASQDARSTTQDGTSDTTSTHDATSSETGTVGRAGARDLTTGDDGEMIRRLTGYSGVAASELVALYRATFLNVDMEIIEELGTLFMGLWNNGSDYERNGRYGMGTPYGLTYGFPRF